MRYNFYPFIHQAYAWSSKLMLICLLFLLVAINGFSQSQISGKITDAKTGEALVGATVLIKGTNNGTVTDLSGSFSLSPQSDAKILIVSYIGYKNQEIEIGSRTVFDIQMQEDAGALEEIVVVGYGVQKKGNLSGAIETVDTTPLKSRPVSNVAQALQGTVPNLNIDFNSGEPGQAANINIRGITSINGGNPLILIDNIPSDAVELNRLNPQDIESMSIIKDASAAAIYGARAAFGVILITTKSGVNEGMSINYTNNFSWNRATVLPDKITDPYIYLRIRETSTDNTPWDNQNYSDETYQWARERSNDPSVPGVRINPNDESLWEYMGNRDWTQYFLDDATFSQNHQLALSGASQNANYYLSGGYNRQNGVLKIADDFFDRYTLRTKVNYSPREWFTVGNNTYITTTERELPSHFDLWTLYNFHPTEWDLNPDGSWANTPVGTEAAQLTEGGTTRNKYNSFQTQFTGQLSFWEDMLRVNADYTYRRGNTDINSFTTKYKIGFGPEDIREEGTNAASRTSIIENYNVVNVYATFNKAFGPHQFTAVAGFNQEHYRYEWFSAAQDGLISASLPTIALATGTANVNEYIEEWAVRGAFYRLNYILKNRYIFELNGRYDGSSRFPKDKRFGFFPSASAAWVVSNEAFFKPLENLVSQLKLRASYGSLGNQDVTEYGYIPSMSAYQAGLIVDGERPLAIAAPPLVSDNYSWETVSTFNFGVDLGFLQDKITASFDIYRRDTKDMLTQGKDLPNVLGAAEPDENAADLRTKGWEISLAYNDNINVGGDPLNISARFILSDSRTTITRFDNPNNNLIQFYEGMELGQIWGLQSDGLFQSQEEIDALDQSAIIPWGALSIVPGWPKYKDINGDGAITQGNTLDDAGDLTVIGNKLPRFRYGFNLAMSWKGIDFSVFFQGIGKRDYYPLDYLYWGFYQQPYAGGYSHLLDFYRAADESEAERARHSQAYLDAGLADANTDALYPILQAWLADRNLGERPFDNAKGLAIPQTRYLLSAAYLRLKNLTIGYTLPTSLTQKIKIAQFRIFVSGENLFEWSALKDFYDPEAINDNGNINPFFNGSRGTGSGYAYPFQRRYSMGVNVTF